MKKKSEISVSKKLALVLILFTFFEYSHSQCTINDIVFKSGEKLSYTGYYNWGFIWLNAGYIEFGVSDTVYDDKSVFKFFAKGGSLPNYDWIFKVREHFVSYSDSSSLKPYYSRRRSIEGDYWVRNDYLFNYDENKIYCAINNKNSGKYRDTTDIEPCTFDLLTAVWYTRTLDFSKFEVDQKFPIKVNDEGDIFNLYIRYKGIETIHVKDLDVDVECIKCTVLLIEGTVFNEGEGMTIWVTNDKNKIPVQIEAKILVGSVKAILNNAEGLKYKNTSF